jgi:hypothetical protein
LIHQNNFSQPFLICWDRWLGTQYTGGDVAERNRRTRERIHRQIAIEELKKKTATNGGATANDKVNADVYAARRVLPEEDDESYQVLNQSKATETATSADGVKSRRKSRSKRPSIAGADVSVKEVTDGLKETEKWVHGVVGNVTGAKMR